MTFVRLGEVTRVLVSGLLERAAEPESPAAKSREETTRRGFAGVYSWRRASTAKIVSRNGGVGVSPTGSGFQGGRRASG